LSFSIASLRAGQFPLWNPYLFGRMPFFAANQAALLYPINVLAYWLGPHHFWVAAALLYGAFVSGATLVGCLAWVVWRLLRKRGQGALARCLV
jgi:hypothetical protein